MRLFWSETRADPEMLVNDAAAGAALTSDWIEACYDSGRTPLHIVCNALLGVHDEWPQLKGGLLSCWRDLRNWEDGRPFALQRLWPSSWVQATECLALAWGWWSDAAALWVGLHCMLRPGEICALPWHLLRPPEELDGHLSYLADVLQIERPETRRFSGRRQRVLIESPWLFRWLRTRRRYLPAADPGLIFPLSPAALNRRLRALAERFAPAGHGLTAAGLRAGGAAHFLRSKRSIEWLRQRGRWRAFVRLAHYVQQCSAVLAGQNQSAS